MDYSKKSKTGTLKIDPVKTRQLGTGIGQDQEGMMATGGWRMNMVAGSMPANQARVAPEASKARPAIPVGYMIPADDMTAGGVSFDEDDKGNPVAGKYGECKVPPRKTSY